ncbi:flagellar protein FliS [Thalassotalea loyana]|uniref:Flagellar secretion chaperone FliS n=1 Tax=Thalassotalea loyana TaxID=280483 RepID=A0ABQ6HBD9_9GAMM|nr:flagellar export chaperone FliS [Thalassotalea loyana]GLX84650.1 flagellar protein FliS [Thalassotalea loyana]
MANLNLKYYQKEATKTSLADAEPYMVTKMLMGGVVESLVMAKGAVERGDYQERARTISKASNIIEALRSSIDFEAGGEVCQNLYALYQYMLERLADASMAKDTVAIEEVHTLFKEIKAGWDAIPVEARQEAEAQRKVNQSAAV